MGYIMNLRKLVGHIPLLQCGAGVIIEDEEERILLQLRTDNGCWGIPGGSIELDEEVEEAAKREVFEETGLKVEDLHLFGIFSGKELHYIYPNGDEVSNIDIVFSCRHYSGELKLDDDHESRELRFFNINRLPMNISAPQRKSIEAYVKYIKSLHM